MCLNMSNFHPLAGVVMLARHNFKLNNITGKGEFCLFFTYDISA